MRLYISAFSILLVLSPDQLLCAPCSLIKNRVWIPSLGKLGHSYKVFWHVAAPIRLLREVSRLNDIINSQLADCWAS